MPLSFYPDFQTKNLLYEADSEFPENKISDIATFNRWYENFTFCNITGEDDSGEARKYDYFFRGMGEAKHKLYNSAQREWLSNNMEGWGPDQNYLKFIKTLVEEAKTAPLVVLRGRTDGTTDSSAESRIAQARANAVRDYLIAAGVDATRIRTTHQPSGDHLADNGSQRGRNLNRRVEIEVYRVTPASAQATAPPQL